MKIIIVIFLFFIMPCVWADDYAVYDKDGEIINVIIYDGIAEYDEKVFHGSDAKKIVLGKTDLDENVGIGDKYKNGKFQKKAVVIE